MNTDNDNSGILVTPGDIVTHLNDNIVAGVGTYVLGDQIYASLVGELSYENHVDGKKYVHVVNDRPVTVVPQINDIVVARVMRITSRVARVEIISTGSSLLRSTFQGIIRARDVRAFDVDNVELWKCFRPGDIIKAEVLSMGDARSYILSTAKNELGVILAKNLSSGEAMVPISWQHMQCPVTLVKEFRKCASVL